MSSLSFFFNDTATTEIYTLSLHDALPICVAAVWETAYTEPDFSGPVGRTARRSEEHTSELQSLRHLVCRLLLEKKKIVQHELHAYLRDDRTGLPRAHPPSGQSGRDAPVRP